MGDRVALTFGEILRRHRLLAGLTQEQLGTRAGLSERGISDLERGVRQIPHPATVQKLARALELGDDERAALEAAAGHRLGAKPPPAVSSQSLPNLPSPPTPLLGRARELAEVRGLLESSRLLTLTGAGGCGKSRLALEIARDVAATDPAGVRSVELAALSDSDDVARAAAAVLSVREHPDQPLEATLAAALRGRRLLILLDNCEHLVDACAELSDTLLRNCPGVRILATSRTPLGLAGETTWRVPSLPFPPLVVEAGALGREAIKDPGEYAAVQLFCARATAALPGFALDAANAEAVGAICRRLDGIPLAIELAAPWVRVLPIDELAARLARDLDLIATTKRGTPPRQRTLRAALDWSYSLLDSPEQILLQRLAVFAGSFTLPAVQAVAGPDEAGEVGILTALARLVDASLVVAEPAIGRYRLLETIRLAALERLRASGEVEVTRRRHAAYYRNLARAALPALWDSHPERDRWFDELDRDLDNVRVAWRFAEETGDLTTCHWLGGALQAYFNNRGFLVEARERLATVLDRSEGDDPHARAWALLAAATLARSAEKPDEAVRYASAGLTLFRQLDDPRGLAHTLVILGSTYAWWEDVATARPLLEEALERCRVSRDGPGLGIPLFQLGLLAIFEGDYARAESLLKEGLNALRERGDAFRVSHLLFVLGFLELARGQPETARTRLDESLAIVIERRDTWGLAFVVDGFAGLLARGKPERALRLAGAAQALRERYDVHVSIRALLHLRDELIAPAWNSVDPEASASAWRIGYALPIEEVLAELAMTSGKDAAGRIISQP